MLEGQTTEDEFYNNGKSFARSTSPLSEKRVTDMDIVSLTEKGGQDFEEFMEWVGDKTLLQNWNGFAGGLDTTSRLMRPWNQTIHSSTHSHLDSQRIRWANTVSSLSMVRRN